MSMFLQATSPPKCILYVIFMNVFTLFHAFPECMHYCKYWLSVELHHKIWVSAGPLPVIWPLKGLETTSFHMKLHNSPSAFLQDPCNQMSGRQGPNKAFLVMVLCIWSNLLGEASLASTPATFWHQAKALYLLRHPAYLLAGFHAFFWVLLSCYGLLRLYFTVCVVFYGSWFWCL